MCQSNPHQHVLREKMMRMIIHDSHDYTIMINIWYIQKPLYRYFDKSVNLIFPCLFIYTFLPFLPFSHFCLNFVFFLSTLFPQNFPVCVNISLLLLQQLYLWIHSSSCSRFRHFDCFPGKTMLHLPNSGISGNHGGTPHSDFISISRPIILASNPPRPLFPSQWSQYFELWKKRRNSIDLENF